MSLPISTLTNQIIIKSENKPEEVEVKTTIFPTNIATTKYFINKVDVVGETPNSEFFMEFCYSGEKFVDPFSCDNTETYIRRWLIGSKEFRLIQDNENISYELLDRINKSIIQKKNLLIPQLETIQDKIKCLLSCELIINDNHTPSFILPPTYEICHQWEIENNEITLLRKNNDLIWQLFNKNTKTIAQVPFNESTFKTFYCESTTKRKIEIALKNYPLEHKIDFIKKHLALVPITHSIARIQFLCFKIFSQHYVKSCCPKYQFQFAAKEELSILGSGREFVINTSDKWIFNGPSCVFSQTIIKTKELDHPIHPFYIGIEPISKKSRIDDRVSVSQLIWAVTLVAHTGCDGNHAEIRIEGISDGFDNSQFSTSKNPISLEQGQYFMYVSHYRPSIESDVIFPGNEEAEYEERSAIYLAPSEKIKKMLIEIKKEKETPLKEKSPFSFFGSDSIVGRGCHNCTTWAREKLKMLNINLDDQINYLKLMSNQYKQILITKAKDYTEKDEVHLSCPPP